MPHWFYIENASLNMNFFLFTSYFNFYVFMTYICQLSKLLGSWADQTDMQVYDCVRHYHSRQLSTDKFQVLTGSQAQLQLVFFAIHGYKFIINRG